MKITYPLNEFIKKIRGDSKVNEIASETGFKNTTIWNYEKGASSIPLEYLIKLAAVKGIDNIVL